ncbi:hypothetical protein DBV23_04965 [Edwardsiella ictaluri]|uniref:Uncharacterized protein n=1 Tax=Edwardsiella ictaluri (strain 93-146) TaxID=634503 RepID=C5B794_EDWI9|nr:hypothetical protein [Edwardsiella ictaluri]ACR67868.1 hypothetical protein NT01EI_0645 [Edwardsiella ictaluri 93-146]ARD40321.1 hypothetical protein B6E78_13910 [Edwardsiella ictaluri]AVZ81690.1 hypothetical protein DBV23_04965 [Edwardsiella ictaluri]EKS7761967.1 hypothetical protein [Edwardsiella ictaluri]EKS7768777.1 hypothetical protein [Edwardsiella ictaluri]
MQDLIAASPDLLSPTSIALLIQRPLRLLFRQVESGRLRLPGFYPDTIKTTRRQLSVIIWMFALSMPYPFFPCANTRVFKSVSVFLGLMITQDSAGLVSLAMSGLIQISSLVLHQGIMFA